MKKPIDPKNIKGGYPTYLPAFHGFYESIYEPNFDGEAEHFNLPRDFEFWEYFDYKAYHNAIAERLCDVVEDRMSQFVKKIVYENLYSPREYNFTTDSINCTIVPKKRAIKKFLKEHEEAFKQYIHDHCTSRDGFISFTSNTLEGWKEYTNNFTDYSEKGLLLGFVLDFIVEQMLEEDEEGPMSQMDQYYGVRDKVSETEFYTEEFWNIVKILDEGKDNSAVNFQFLSDNSKYWVDQLLEGRSLPAIIDEVKTFIKDRYASTEDLYDITAHQFEQYSELLNIFVIVEQVVSEIESHTLQINFE